MLFRNSALPKILLFALAWIAPLRLPAQSAASDTLIDRTGRQISAYLDEISDVKCTETVVQEKLAPNGHKEREQRATYDYLVLLQGTHDDFFLSESRLPQKESARPQDALPMLLTNGFSNLFLIFHPYYRDSFRFELGVAEVINGSTLIPVKFTHVPGTRTPAALAIRSREYPLELTGTAWIDASTAMITKMTVSLQNDLHDVGLRAMNVEVAYAPISLPGWERAVRLPTVAKVDVQTNKQHWRNVHEFTNYKRFSVDTESTVAAVKGN
ncbi:MAG TPA: hypothetical protein VF786_07585 [Terriglobales bacterium]